MEKTYLGDGVYAELKHGMIKLSVERGYGEHFIYLELQVYEALQRFADRAKTVLD